MLLLMITINMVQLFLIHFRLCYEVDIDATSPVTVKYEQSGKHSHVTQPRMIERKSQLCMKVDTIKPTHCSEDTPSCSYKPLTVSARITKNPSITVSFNGWSDPHQKGLSNTTASGLKEIDIEAYEMTSLGNILAISSTIHVREKVTPSETSKTITLPSNQLLYCIILTAKDVAGNYHEARRFVLYDSKSSVQVDTKKKIWSPTGSADTNNLWQIILGDVKFTWSHFFFNSFQRLNNMLKPIRPDMSRFAGMREQTSGQLPLAGTPNVDGVITFSYYVTKDKSRVQSASHDSFAFSEVRNFPSQDITLTNINTEDGDRIFFFVKAGKILISVFGTLKSGF